MKKQPQQAKPKDLNYHYYSMNTYDRGIVAAIPFHRELHTALMKNLQGRFRRTEPIRVLDLGVGTGLTSQLIQSAFPNAQFEVIDFSSTMLRHAKKRLGNKGVVYRLGDFLETPFAGTYDVIVAVIGVHHLTDTGKQKLFKKISQTLKPHGVFLFGDLMTCKNEKTAAENNARHYHHLVEKSKNNSELREWTHHHMFLNNLATVEEQEAWLQKEKLKVKNLFSKLNTVLISAEK